MDFYEQILDSPDRWDAERDDEDIPVDDPDDYDSPYVEE